MTYFVLAKRGPFLVEGVFSLVKNGISLGVNEFGLSALAFVLGNWVTKEAA